jgi:signal transduction histidine kinase/CHASE3 domain sensor protein
METELGGVLSGLHEMTASTRGYILTGQLESIVPYDPAFVEVSAHLRNVNSITRNEKSLHQMFDTLNRLIQTRKKLLDELIMVYKQSRYSSDSISKGKIAASISEGDGVMNEIRIHVKAMIAYEEYLYKQKVSSGDNFNNQAYILIICFGLLTITVSLYGYLIIQKENRQKQVFELQLNDYYSKMEKANTMLTEAEKIAKMGSWEWEIASGKVRWSDGVYNVYNLSHDQFIPSFQSFIDIIHKEDRPHVIASIEDAMQRKTAYQIEFREIASKENRTIFAVGLPRFDNKNNLDSYFGILMNITQQRNYEKQLEDFNNALKKSNDELEQFAYAASHDLQEPLRKIRSFGDRLIFKYGSETELPGKDYVVRMMDGAERMQTLIQDLLAFSRISRDVGDKTTVDLNIVVKNVMDDLQLSLTESNAKVEVSNLPQLASANPVQMHQLFLNILGNAIKFSKPGTAPEIRISVKTVPGSSIHLPDEEVPSQEIYNEITIHDNGIGFDEQYLDKIFTIFQRLHGRNEYKGTGIGLAICKKICKNHDGFITAKSDGRSGSDFIIYLPK